jgi:TRAP-type mannitol/chloroaromatic compound transport system substrate-binding protein
MNKESYEALSNDLKIIVRDACHAAALEAPAEFFANSGLSLDVLVNKHNVDVRPFPKDVITKMFSISKEVVEETASLGEMHAKIYKSWSEFLEQSMRYQKYSDYGYMRDRSEAYGI